MRGEANEDTAKIRRNLVSCDRCKRTSADRTSTKWDGVWARKIATVITDMFQNRLFKVIVLSPTNAAHFIAKHQQITTTLRSFIYHTFFKCDERSVYIPNQPLQESVTVLNISSLSTGSKLWPVMNK